MLQTAAKSIEEQNITSDVGGGTRGTIQIQLAVTSAVVLGYVLELTKMNWKRPALSLPNALNMNITRTINVQYIQNTEKRLGESVSREAKYWRKYVSATLFAPNTEDARKFIDEFKDSETKVFEGFPTDVLYAAMICAHASSAKETILQRLLLKMKESHEEKYGPYLEKLRKYSAKEYIDAYIQKDKDDPDYSMDVDVTEPDLGAPTFEEIRGMFRQLGEWVKIVLG